MKKIFIAAILLAFGTVLNSYSSDYMKASPKDMQWFLDAKFGMFIHWGPVSQMGGDLSWSRGGEKRGWKADSPGYIPVDVYDNLYKTFNPVD